jgi:hypothetical protein
MIKALAVVIFCLSWYGIRRTRRVVQSRQQFLEQNLADSQRKLEQAQHRIQQLIGLLTALHEYKVSPTGRVPWKDLADFSVQTAHLALGVERVLLFQWNPETTEYMGVASRGLPPQQADHLSVRLGEGVLGKVAQLGQVYNSDGDTSGMVAGESYLLAPFLVVPLWGRSQVSGLLVLCKPAQGRIQSEWQRMAVLLAKQIEMTLENLQFYEQRQRVYGDLVETVIRLVGAKDPETQQHSDHCRIMVDAMAEEMHLPEVLKEQLRFGAILHDVGKIAIDKSILLKAGPLTAEEYAQVKTHPEVGYHLLLPVSFLKGVVPIVLYHQEWYNGQGYPEGLAGEEIPLGARMVQIVDAWDAMTHDQPYRKAMARNNAIAELRQQAGAQFDPKLVDIFLRVVERFERTGSEFPETNRRPEGSGAIPSPLVGEG